MDCKTSRALFSEHYDRRLRGESLIHLMDHLSACGDCQREWDRYHRVFDLVRAMPAPVTPPPFHRPVEPPGAVIAFRDPALSRWRRAAVAAGFLALVGLASAFLFKLGQGAFSIDSADGDLPAVSRMDTATVAEPVSDRRREVRETWRDNLDATQVILNEIALMSDPPTPEDLELVRAKLAMIDPEGLLDPGQDVVQLGSAGVYAGTYVRSLSALSRVLARQAAHRSGTSPVQCLREQQRRLRHLHNSWVGLMAELSGEASGNSWRRNRERLEKPLQLVQSEEVREFLAAEVPFFAARYAKANECFDSFRSRNPRGTLGQLARYVQSETLARMRRYAEAIRVASDLPAPRISPPLPGTIRVIRVFPTRPLAPMSDLKTLMGLMGGDVRLQLRFRKLYRPKAGERKACVADICIDIPPGGVSGEKAATVRPRRRQL